MSDFQQIKHLQLKLQPEDEDAGLAALMDGIFYNSFAIFVVKVVSKAEREELLSLSRTLESFVAGYIQNNEELINQLGDKDIIWDIYLVFLTTVEISVQAKVELENDRFFCKKIVLPYNPEMSMEDHLLQMVIFQQFEDLSKRAGDYLEKDEFVKKLVERVQYKRLGTFLQKNNLLEMEVDELIRLFRKNFGLSAGEKDV